MTGAKHTPGPWVYEPSADGHSLIKAADGTTICLMALGDIDDEERDARTIAATPDLIEALIAMVRKYAPPDDGYPGTSPAHQARAALAKAEGGAS